MRTHQERNYFYIIAYKLNLRWLRQISVASLGTFSQFVKNNMSLSLSMKVWAHISFGAGCMLQITIHFPSHSLSFTAATWEVLKKNSGIWQCWIEITKMLFFKTIFMLRPYGSHLEHIRRSTMRFICFPQTKKDVNLLVLKEPCI